MTEGTAEGLLTPAALVARFLKARNITRIFGLQGGHIQPIWDQVLRLDIPIVDVRHEGAAVHMAQAHAELTGELGVAMATAGPGVANTVTAIANASLARTPLLLIGGCPPRPQANMGPLQGIPHVDVLRPITRCARTAAVPDQVLRELDEAVARAQGDAGEPGPAYLEIPTDVLRQPIAAGAVLDEHLRPKPARILMPDPAAVAAAADALLAARRPLVISGRGARGAGSALVRLLERLGALYLDTQESRGVVPNDHPAAAGAMRARAMAEADMVLLVGRKLDYQLGYGSPAVFPNARFVRIADTASELFDNRRGAVELLATPAAALDAIVAAISDRHGTGRRGAADESWVAEMREQHRGRTRQYAASLSTAPSGSDGYMHPNRIFAAIRQVAPADAIAIADGGDILSFARLGLNQGAYLDSGAFGCLGVGVPFAVAAALAFPGRKVISVNGDGAFGIHAMEIDTAVRHGAKCVFIVANNAAWNIERYDQQVNYGGRVAGTLLRHSDYAGMARALGARGERVQDPQALPAALERALNDGPALLDVLVTQDAISSDAHKGLSLVPDYQALTAWDESERLRYRQ
jgi:acetolactate synthase-1/2/3 large subunit